MKSIQLRTGEIWRWGHLHPPHCQFRTVRCLVLLLLEVMLILTFKGGHFSVLLGTQESLIVVDVYSNNTYSTTCCCLFILNLSFIMEGDRCPWLFLMRTVCYWKGTIHQVSCYDTSCCCSSHDTWCFIASQSSLGLITLFGMVLQRTSGPRTSVHRPVLAGGITCAWIQAE